MSEIGSTTHETESTATASENEIVARVSELSGRGVPSLATERDSSHEKHSDLHTSSAMPAVVTTQALEGSISALQSPQTRVEPVFKLERSESGELTDGSADCDNKPGSCYDLEAPSAASREHPGFLGEEPLEIQCGENSALLYVSKLCQGSKGPCILFNNEWLTPNELQYISGRETAKDWKRSIRYKGKSLKSLIARGLIKVHPPICDCLGCRISSPVNRGRLASKCGLPPSSPRNRKRDTTKSLSCWSQDDLQTATAQRHFSTSDIECLARQAASNGLKLQERRDSSSSATSECSEAQDDNPFSPVKRARSISPEERSEGKGRVFKRRASDSASSCFFPSHPGGENLQYDPRALSMRRELTARYLMSGERVTHSKDVPGDQKDKSSRGDDDSGTRGEGAETRSAFRAVHQDGLIGMSLQEVTPESYQREMAMRAAKLHKQKPPPSPARGGPPQYLPNLSHHIPAGSLVSPTHTSPRLPPESLLLPHSNMYHPALRGAGYPSMQQLQQNLMQYRLLAPPPGVGNPHSPQSPLVGLSLQSKLLMHESAVAAMTTNTCTTEHASEKMPRHLENGIAASKKARMSETSDNHRVHPAALPEEPSEKREQLNGDKTNHVSVIHRSPAQSPISIDGNSEPHGSPCAKEHPTRTRVSPHKLIPKLRLELDDNILSWTVEDVCQFITSLTGAPEVANEFKDQSIDGQSLILLQEEHLLSRMGIKLGPALKIKAHIRKIVEKLQASEQTLSDSS